MVIVLVLAVPLLHVDGVTVMLPLLDPTVTFTEFVPCPLLIVQPDGTAHV